MIKKYEHVRKYQEIITTIRDKSKKKAPSDSWKIDILRFDFIFL